ncbi:DHH phosphoesterase [Cryptosporidium felis]|nr:DHH phosphoesterase [Cryptosporidium felis]
MTGSPANFDGKSPVFGLHVPVINCRRAELRQKFPLISLVGYFSGIKEVSVERIPFVCLDDEFFENLLKGEGEAPFVTLVDHNELDSFLKASFQDRVVSVVDHHEDLLVTPSTHRLSLGTRIGSCSTLIGKIRELFEKRWSSLDFEICCWIRKAVGMDEDTALDLYSNHLRDSNRNVRLILNCELRELFGMDYKEFEYGNKQALVGYSSFEISIETILNHYNFENKALEEMRAFMTFKHLDLFVLLGTFLASTESEKESDSHTKGFTGKQLLICGNDLELLTSVTAYLSNKIEISELSLGFPKKPERRS